MLQVRGFDIDFGRQPSDGVSGKADAAVVHAARRGVEIIFADRERPQVLELWRIAEAAYLEHVGVFLEFDDVADGVHKRRRGGGHADRADYCDLPQRRRFDAVFDDAASPEVG